MTALPHIEAGTEETQTDGLGLAFEFGFALAATALLPVIWLAALMHAFEKPSPVLAFVLNILVIVVPAALWARFLRGDGAARPRPVDCRRQGMMAPEPEGRGKRLSDFMPPERRKCARLSLSPEI